MRFWAYMLHCRGGYFYVGHTEDLGLRMAQHHYGEVSGFAADHRPVELVWSQEFASREEAKAAEKQIKGWSRANKLALIRGDWDKISSLAKGTGSPSTSSGKSVLGATLDPNTAHPELVEGLPLLCHPDTPLGIVSGVAVSISRNTGRDWQIDFAVQAKLDELRIPGPSAPLRRDGLWRTTCFELFILHRQGPAYLELNFSPSSEWAAYGFAGYRDQQRADVQMPVPPIVDIWLKRADHMITRSIVRLPSNLHPTRLALSAVIEETNGSKSYWALRHPPGPPDFHHPDCFALTLEAPPAA